MNIEVSSKQGAQPPLSPSCSNKDIKLLFFITKQSTHARG